jgi:hypothetical protein
VALSEIELATAQGKRHGRTCQNENAAVRGFRSNRPEILRDPPIFSPGDPANGSAFVDNLQPARRLLD